MMIKTHETTGKRTNLKTGCETGGLNTVSAYSAREANARMSIATCNAVRAIADPRFAISALSSKLPTNGARTQIEKRTIKTIDLFRRPMYSNSATDPIAETTVDASETMRRR